jgi:hypothetical protein
MVNVYYSYLHEWLNEDKRSQLIRNKQFWSKDTPKYKEKRRQLNGADLLRNHGVPGVKTVMSLHVNTILYYYNYPEKNSCKI